MATFTSITQYQSISSSLYQKLHESGIFHPSKSAQEHSSSCSLVVSSARIQSRRLNCHSMPMRLSIRNAATKPAKSPAEEEWKVKREVLLQKRFYVDMDKPKICEQDNHIETQATNLENTPDHFGQASEIHSFQAVPDENSMMPEGTAPWLHKSKNMVRSVEVKEALRLLNENNFVMLDVRPEAEFKEGHAPGAINVQIYRLIKEWTAWDIARRAAFAFFGIFSGTEENPNFLPEVEAKIDKNAKIIVACSAGGTMRPSPNLREGQQSRSLIAAYLLVLDGYTNVFHLDGGLYNWLKEGLPVVTEE
ncbi:hypothetical protein Cgig2_016012 [Carnegiea gigantea]|uniref:Rhodanese domain-containing protein n=1 Tax=Carnegiea gigantea TaxID=171969 RepID=A0A9Q1KP07_9CARY|nr:hypothetical protein Cgig2_016012 [Carnegiea gigantea]